MARVMLNEMDVDNVAGGSIIFNTDHTTCGLNCDNQCKVNNYDKALAYVLDNYNSMSERDIMRNLLAKGYISML